MNSDMINSKDMAFKASPQRAFNITYKGGEREFYPNCTEAWFGGSCLTLKWLGGCALIKIDEVVSMNFTEEV